MLIETRGSTDVVGVVVEFGKMDGVCETPKVTGGHGVVLMGVETVAMGEGIEKFSRNQ